MDMGSGRGDKMGESSQVHATVGHAGGVEPRGETTGGDGRHELGASYPRTPQASTQNRSHGWRQVFVGGWSMEHAERAVETCLGWRKSLLECGSETHSGGVRESGGHGSRHMRRKHQGAKNTITDKGQCGRRYSNGENSSDPGTSRCSGTNATYYAEMAGHGRLESSTCGQQTGPEEAGHRMVLGAWHRTGAQQPPSAHLG